MNGVKREESKGSPLMVSKLKCHFIRNINIHSRMTANKQTNRPPK